MRSPRIQHYDDMEQKVEASRPFNDTLSEITTFVRWGMRDARAEGYAQALREFINAYGDLDINPWYGDMPTTSIKYAVKEFAASQGITLETDNG